MPPVIKNFLDLKKIPLGYLFALYITWMDPLHGILQPFGCSSCERGNKSLPEPILTQFCVNLWWNYELISSSISLHTLHLGHQINWILAPMYPLRGQTLSTEPNIQWLLFFCFALPTACLLWSRTSSTWKRSPLGTCLHSISPEWIPCMVFSSHSDEVAVKEKSRTSSTWKRSPLGTCLHSISPEWIPCMVFSSHSDAVAVKEATSHYLSQC